jgi:hypothetical protein
MRWARTFFGLLALPVALLLVLESLSVHPGAEGESILTLISHHNFSTFSARCCCSSQCRRKW